MSWPTRLQANTCRACAGCLRDTPDLDFQMLMDLTAVDYLQFGRDEWQTISRRTPDSAAVASLDPVRTCPRAMHASPSSISCSRSPTISAAPAGALRHGRRAGGGIRDRRVGLAQTGSSARPSTSLASCFRGHPDLRRLLTDYGFIGHPFRKDFRSAAMSKYATTPTRSASSTSPSPSSHGC